jgi:biotin synthase-like enzyme
MICTSDARSDLIARAEQGCELDREEITDLLCLSEPALLKRLYRAADRVRAACVGEEVFLRASSSSRAIAVNNCRYCGLRRDNRTARDTAWTMTPS